MIPSQIKYDPNATPPQLTDNEDYRIEPGTHIRVKIMGTRSEVGEMWATGTIHEDYLGYVPTRLHLVFVFVLFL
jgi:DNA-directed RNA polymerase II subunit RPB7